MDEFTAMGVAVFIRCHFDVSTQRLVVDGVEINGKHIEPAPKSSLAHPDDNMWPLISLGSGGLVLCQMGDLTDVT